MQKHNHEHYSDPTAYHALVRIEKEHRRPLVYICSPFSGDTAANIGRARKYCRFAVDCGAVPIAPHLLFPQFADERTERDSVMDMDLIILDRCDELWVFGESISSGMRTEIKKGKRKNMKIRYFTEELEERKNA